MALELGALARPRAPSVDVLWLSREDQESLATSRGVATDGVVRRDWIREWPSPPRLASRALRRLAPLKRRLAPLLPPTYERLARQRLRRGCRILAGGRAVITDRLHGHILSLLLGLPHVVLDNSYGKNRAFYETWTASSPLAAWADSAAEAIARVRDSTWP
jgi:pyruvyl transferase EpsO